MWLLASRIKGVNIGESLEADDQRPRVQRALRKRFGAIMNQDRLYNLRAEVTGKARNRLPAKGKRGRAERIARASLARLLRELRAEMARAGLEHLEIPARGPVRATYSIKP